VIEDIKRSAERVEKLREVWFALCEQYQAVMDEPFGFDDLKIVGDEMLKAQEAVQAAESTLATQVLIWLKEK